MEEHIMREKDIGLKYKTRGNSSPNQKQNVYFCCHDDDFQLYFEKISNSILKHSDCAIWFKDPDSDYDFQDIISYLDSMRLFIVPITRKFLLNENSAFSNELKYAIDNKITILALMEQDGLEVVFNETCGHIQSLNQAHNDEKSKQIFDEKLNHFLGSILIETGEQERIREELSASIFISYRKKDKKQVEQLINNLHQNETLRDVGIWYDEYLVPGEDFDEAIENAIKTSELFLMVITPNIVEKDNYVQKIEYPLARQEHKRIIPVQFISVEDQELSRCFDGIPESVSSNPWEIVNKKIEGELGNLLKDDNSAEHLYYIGLAYLTGTNMKTDKVRGYELIHQAADSGYFLAEERLGRMYEYGDGVESDEILATFWYEKYFDHFSEIIHNINDSEIIVIFLRQMRNVEAIYRNLEIDNKIISTKKRIISIAKDFQRSSKDDKFQKIELLESLRLVKFYLKNDQLVEAGNLLFELEKKANSVIDNYKSSDDLLNLLLWIEVYGVLSYKKGYNDSAKDYFNRAIEIRQTNTYINSLIINKESLWEDYMYLTKIYIFENNLAEAKLTIDRALSVIKSVVDGRRDDDSTLKVVDTYILCGDLELSLKGKDAALQNYNNALEIFRERITNNGKLKFSQYKQYATLYEKIGNIDITKKELLSDALDLWHYLSKQFPRKKEYKLHIQQIESQLGGE